jgi:hypothetical protein
VKKILILSYHFEPLNAIASQRSLGYANHFKKFGFEPTIVTLQWENPIKDQFCRPSDILEKIIFRETLSYKVYKLPVGNFFKGKILNLIEKSYLRKIGILVSWISGHLDTSSILLNCSLTERTFLKHHLKENKYDIILGVFSPHYHLKNCSWASSKYNTPFILDYRDLWDNRVLHLVRKQNNTEKLKTFFTMFWWKKWANNAMFSTITSEVWATKLNEVTKNKTYVIFNGFETSLRNEIKETKTNKFSIVSTGTIYPDQNLDIISEGMKLFLEKIDTKLVSFDFIGLEKENSDIKDKIEKLKKLFPKEILNITKRIPKREALEFQKNASILIFPSTPNIPGTLSGKIYEYISSGKIILVSPIDKGAVSDLVRTTNTGVSLSNSNDIANFLMLKYEEWQKYGFCKAFGFEKEILKYSRKNQTEKLSNLIKEALK